MPGHKIIVIDTNLALHYKRIDQIDWLAVAEATSCTLAITPVLLRELEHHKVINKSKVLRDRAAKTVDYFVELMDRPDPITIRAGVTVSFVGDEPAIDFAANRLKEAIADDHFIASAIELASGTTHAVVIGSADAGMKMKLRSRAIGVLRLADTLKLPDELDPLEKELRDTKRELQKMQARQPLLTARFADGSTLLRLKKGTPGPPPGIKTPTDIRREHPRKGRPAANRTGFQPPAVGALGHMDIAGMGSMAAARTERENVAIDRYHSSYDRYYSEASARHDWIERSHEIPLVLINDGSGPATVVEAQFGFPTRMKPGRLSDAPELPEEPEPPTTQDILRAYQPTGALLRHLAMPQLQEFHDGRPVFGQDESQVYFDAANLRPKSRFILDTFLITLDDFADATPFEIEVTIRCNELEPIRQRLAVVFDDTPSEEP